MKQKRDRDVLIGDIFARLQKWNRNLGGCFTPLCWEEKFYYNPDATLEQYRSYMRELYPNTADGLKELVSMLRAIGKEAEYMKDKADEGEHKDSLEKLR